MKTRFKLTYQGINERFILARTMKDALDYALVHDMYPIGDCDGIPWGQIDRIEMWDTTVINPNDLDEVA